MLRSRSFEQGLQHYLRALEHDGVIVDPRNTITQIGTDNMTKVVVCELVVNQRRVSTLISAASLWKGMKLVGPNLGSSVG